MARTCSPADGSSSPTSEPICLMKLSYISCCSRTARLTRDGCGTSAAFLTSKFGMYVAPQTTDGHLRARVRLGNLLRKPQHFASVRAFQNLQAAQLGVGQDQRTAGSL